MRRFSASLRVISLYGCVLACFVLSSDISAQPPNKSAVPNSDLPGQPYNPPRSPLVESVALSPDGKIAVTGNEKGTITLWEAQTGQILREIKAHNSRPGLPSNFLGITAVFSPDSAKLLTVGFKEINEDFRFPDGTKGIVPTVQAKLWDVKTGELLWTIEPKLKPNLPSSGLAFPTFSPDGRFLATSQGYEGVNLWDAQTGKLLRELAMPYVRLNALAFSPDSKNLAGGGARSEGSFENETFRHVGEILLWDTKQSVYRAKSRIQKRTS